VGSSVFVPRRLVEEIEKRGLNLEDTIIEALSKALNFDPKTIAESRLELAERYLAEGRSLVDKDPVQASEKLYKAAEECVKALAMHFNLEDILRSVKKRGKWAVADLEKAVEASARWLAGGLERLGIGRGLYTYGASTKLSLIAVL